MMKHVLLIAAPFGFGPASRALLLSNMLGSKGVKTTISTVGDAFNYVRSHAKSDVQCLNGRLDHVFKLRDLEQFDLILSLNNVPVVNALVNSGVGERVVLFDSLLHWRKGRDEVKLKSKIRGYLVQDFPSMNPSERTCEAERFEVISPAFWKPRDSLQTPRSGISISLGGVTSAIVKWEDVSDNIEVMIQAVVKAARHLGEKVHVIGHPKIPSLKICEESEVEALGTVDPESSVRIMASSRLLLTTPGINTVYEAIHQATPLLMMPPGNSTQLNHFDVLVERGLGHVVPNRNLKSLIEVSNRPWTEQASELNLWINAHASVISNQIQRTILDVFTNRDFSSLVDGGQSLMKGLSGVDMMDVIMEFLKEG